MKALARKKDLDLKLVLLLAGFYTFFNLIHIAKSAYLRNYYPEDIFQPWHEFLLEQVAIDWLTVVAYMTLIAISTKRLLNKRYSWAKIITIHTVLSLFLGVLVHFIYDLSRILSGKISPTEFQIEESVRRFMSVIDLNFLIYFAMVFIIYIYFYVKQVKESRKQRNILEGQLVNTRVKMLSSQLQPHFLFNTLNSISVLVDMDAAKAKDTIADLSDFLRESLYSSHDNEIPLEKELRTLEYYLNILNVRFSDHLQIRKEIDKKLLSQKVPAMLLQPLIENSIKHGYSYEHPNLEILISVQAEADCLVIKVENSGQALGLSQHELLQKGIGLSNINDRLENLYGKDKFFEIRNKADGSGVETIIKIPL